MWMEPIRDILKIHEKNRGLDNLNRQADRKTDIWS